MSEHNRVCAQIDLDAVSYNMEQMKNQIGKEARLIAVIKTDGYGHGAVPIAQMFETFSYVWGYAVACIEEAVALREAGIKKPILVLGCIFPDQYETMVEQEIRAAVYTKVWRKECLWKQYGRERRLIFILRSIQEWDVSAFR